MLENEKNVVFGIGLVNTHSLLLNYKKKAMDIRMKSRSIIILDFYLGTRFSGW